MAAIVIKDDSLLDKIELGFFYKYFAHSFLPYRRINERFYEKRSMNCTVTLVTSYEEGLPYGVIPRLLMIWITTEAIRKKSKFIGLPRNMAGFIEELGLRKNGGARGDITRVREQFSRLIHMAFSLKSNNSDVYQVVNVFPIERANLWWDQHVKENVILRANIELSEAFFAHIISASIPINMDVVRHLTDSCMAVDIYLWLCLKFAHLKNKVFIPWGAIKEQFGGEYVEGAKGLSNFKAEFLKQLQKVITHYPEAKIWEADDKKGLLIYPSPTSVPKLPPDNVLAYPKKKAVSEVVVNNPKTEVLDELVAKIEQDFGLPSALVHKIIQGKTVGQLNNAMASVSELIKNGLGKNPQALIRKAIAECWLPVDGSAVPKQACDVVDYLEVVKNKLADNAYAKIGQFYEMMHHFYGPTVFKNWFTKLHFVRSGENKLYFQAETRFIKEWVSVNYLEGMKQKIKELDDTVVSIQIDVRS
jgi:hypothetical protein